MGSEFKLGSFISTLSPTARTPTRPTPALTPRKCIKTDMLLLVHGEGTCEVKRSNFLMVSQTVAKSLPAAINLKKYHFVSVRALAEYVEKKKLNTKLSFHSMAELLKLAKVYELGDLKQQLERALSAAARSSVQLLLQALIVATANLVSDEIEDEIADLGASHFADIVKLRTFQDLPYHQLINLLSRCELKVSHEMVVVDSILLWLVGQPHPDLMAPALLALVRPGFLTADCKEKTYQRIRNLYLPESIERFARNSFETNHRICVYPSHLSEHLPRCGNSAPSPQRRIGEEILSLSRPRPGITWMERAAAEKTVILNTQKLHDYDDRLQKPTIKKKSKFAFMKGEVPKRANDTFMMKRDEKSRKLRKASVKTNSRRTSNKTSVKSTTVRKTPAKNTRRTK